jgi:hypothetical protein
MFYLNGGPAFPLVAEYRKNGEVIRETFSGMTLRDYFAAKAMQATMINPRIEPCNPEERSRISYQIADAMLKEREK